MSVTPPAGTPPGPYDRYAPLAALVGRMLDARPDLSPRAVVTFLHALSSPGANLTTLKRRTGVKWGMFMADLKRLTRGTPEMPDAPALLVTVDGRRDRRCVHVFPTPAGMALASEALSSHNNDNNNTNNDTKGEHE